MNLRFQELTVGTSSDTRSLTVHMTLFWKCAIGVIALIAVGFGAINGPVGMAIAAGIVLLALLMTFFSNTLIIDSATKQLLLRTEIGPLRGTSTIPFESIERVTISDGGAAGHYVYNGASKPTPDRPTYSLAVEITGKKHLKSLLMGPTAKELVTEAHNLATLCGKPAFIPSALQ